MAGSVWDWIIPLNHDTADLSVGEFRQAGNKGVAYAYDFDNDKHFLASFDMPGGLNDRKGIIDYIKQNADNLIKSSTDVMDDLKDGSNAAINDAFDAFAEKIGMGKMDAPKVLSGGPDLSTTMHINGQTGAVLSERVMEHEHALKKGLGKFGAVGGVVAAGLAMSTGANAAEVTSQVVPGGQSVMASMGGNQLEAKFLLAEETGVGSLVTEIARPVLRGLGADVQSGLLEDAFNWATGRDTKLSSIEISHKQSEILQKAGFPDEIGGKPIEEALRDPAQMEKTRSMMATLDNKLGIQALDRFESFEKQMPSAEARMATNFLGQAMDPMGMARTAANFVMTGKLG